jgi:hypothetical protein
MPPFSLRAERGEKRGSLWPDHPIAGKNLQERMVHTRISRFLGRPHTIGKVDLCVPFLRRFPGDQPAKASQRASHNSGWQAIALQMRVRHRGYDRSRRHSEALKQRWHLCALVSSSADASVLANLMGRATRPRQGGRCVVLDHQFPNCMALAISQPNFRSCSASWRSRFVTACDHATCASGA